MDKQYFQSLSNQEILKSEVAKKLLQFVSPYEATQTLRKYNIGAAQDNQTAFWYVNEQGVPYALTVSGKDYFGAPAIWNVEALSEPNIRKVGICETPEQAFWANMYLRHYAVWVCCGMGTDFSVLNNFNCFAIVTNNRGRYANLLRNIFGIRFYEYEDFKEELFLTGAPKPCIMPPFTPRRKSKYEWMRKALKNDAVRSIIETFELELD